jgi:NMD protein affecting ribosome stability and mRNA decay
MSEKIKVVCQRCGENEVSDPREKICDDCKVEQVTDELDRYSIMDDFVDS